MSKKNTQVRRTIKDLCLKVLAENSNQPLHVDELCGKIIKSGWKTNNKNPRQSVSARLRGDDRFSLVAPNTYKVERTYYRNHRRTILSI